MGQTLLVARIVLQYTHTSDSSLQQHGLVVFSCVQAYQCKDFAVDRFAAIHISRDRHPPKAVLPQKVLAKRVYARAFSARAGFSTARLCTGIFSACECCDKESRRHELDL